MSDLIQYKCPLCGDPNPAREGNSTCKEIEPRGEIYTTCLERQLTATQRREKALREFVIRGWRTEEACEVLAYTGLEP